ncbi:hypothetical protein FRC09_019051 [Ceratobasidium sp. 395]|nr:hypothetical protein FRC09_019051 [Ceratobasidium sp. 395]
MLPTNRPNERSVLEELFATIEFELSSLEDEEDDFYRMRQLLATTRNKSTALAPVNSLPPEILAGIFALSKTCCIKDEKANFLNFAGVCTYWRHIAIHTADLWTHVDIGQGVPEDLTVTLLERTKNTPIYLHMFEPRAFSSPTRTCEAKKVIKTMLSPHVHRIYALDAESRESHGRLITTILNLWLSSGNPNLTKSLFISRQSSSILYCDGESNIATLIKQSETAQTILQNLNKLHLQDVRFDWNSGVYRGLVDLQLSSFGATISISVSRLMDLFTANPTLSKLKLGHLKVIPTQGLSHPAPITLSHLKALRLLHIDRISLQRLLPLIGPPDSSTELSVGFTSSGSIDDLSNFLVTSHATMLYYSNRAETISPIWRSLLKSMSSLRHLVLRELVIIDPLSESNAAMPHQQLFPYIASVTLQQCRVTFGGLKWLTDLFEIRDLRLERCFTAEADGRKLHDLQVPLLEAYPELKLTITDAISAVD